MSEVVTVDGMCPLIDCIEVGEHEHVRCKTCGALGCTNMRCATCIDNIEYNYVPMATLFRCWVLTLEYWTEKVIEYKQS